MKKLALVSPKAKENGIFVVRKNSLHCKIKVRLMRVLIAEDDSFLAKAIILALQKNGYSVEHAASGTEADILISRNKYDLLVLDLGLPKLDGIEVLRNLRARGQTVPVLVLTVRDSIQEKVKGLDSGANDYLTKPFDLAELEARIRALVRKEQWNNKAEITVGPLTYNTVSKNAVLNNESLELTPRELAVLEILLQNIGRIVTRERLCDYLRDLDGDLSDNAIQIIMHRLRKKLSMGKLSLRTIRGVGYTCDRYKE